jgi:predicted DNA-binding antitoxin AbrB/MazE fold protein
MTITIDATYEGGVLKPSQPLPLREHEMVRVTVEQQAARREIVADQNDAASKQPSLADELIALANALPEDVVARLPKDGAAQHDHYIYGTPKRPERP